MEQNEKIRVLHITQVQGGVQTYIEQIYHNIDEERFEIEIACPEEQKSLIKFAIDNNIKYHPIKLKWQISLLSDFIGVFRVIKLVKKVKPNIIHAHSSKAGFVTRLASLFFKPSVLYTPHAYAFLGHSGIKRWLFLNIEKLVRPCTDTILATSKSEYTRSIKEVKLPSSKVQIFLNSIDIPEFTRINKTEPTKSIITTVGRLVHQKNPMMFLEVCKNTHNTHPNTHFQIIGAGFEDKLKTEIDCYIKENNMGDYITIFNWMSRQELIEKIRKTDVFVMTSNFESFGYVAAEAQAIEIPAVCTNVDGLNEIVADKETGFLVKVDDVKGMAEKIIWLLENKEKAKQMGQRGRERVTNNFNIKTNIAILEEIYKKHQVSYV